MTPKGFKIAGDRNLIRKFYKQFPEFEEFWDKKSTKTFSKVITEFHKDFIANVISNRNGVDLPLYMGNLSIVSYKASRRYLNFTKYSNLKQISNFTNNHTDGLSCKIVYESYLRKYRFKDKRIWAFFPEQGFKKLVSKAFSENYTRYIHSPDRTKAFYKLLDYKLRDETDAKVERFLKNYDEFYLN